MQAMAPPAALQRADETDRAAAIMEQVIAKGDLAELTPAQRAHYYIETCRSVGLNYLTKPFDYIELNRKLTLYATRNATDQLRRIYGVSVRIVDEKTIEGVRIVTAEASDATGRADTSIGAVAIAGLRGADLANALMKCETKAKRRVTLSFVGLSFLDETEVESVPGARRVAYDITTGEHVSDVGSPQRGDAEESATPRQIRFAEAIAREIGSDLDREADRRFQAKPSELTRRECSDLIEAMQREAQSVRDAHDAEPIEVDPETGEILDSRNPEAGNADAAPGTDDGRRFAGLHKDIADAAKRDGSGFAKSTDPHDCAHDLAAAKYGVVSLKDLTGEQLGELRQAVKDWDAATLTAAWDRSKAILARRRLPLMPEEPEAETDPDRWTR